MNSAGVGASRNEKYEAEKMCATSIRGRRRSSVATYTVSVTRVRTYLILWRSRNGPGSRGFTGRNSTRTAGCALSRSSSRFAWTAWPPRMSREGATMHTRIGERSDTASPALSRPDIPPPAQAVDRGDEHRRLHHDALHSERPDRPADARHGERRGDGDPRRQEGSRADVAQPPRNPCDRPQRDHGAEIRIEQPQQLVEDELGPDRIPVREQYAGQPGAELEIARQRPHLAAVLLGPGEPARFPRTGVLDPRDAPAVEHQPHGHVQIIQDQA